jgi:hypothetical protein
LAKSQALGNSSVKRGWIDCCDTVSYLVEVWSSTLRDFKTMETEVDAVRSFVDHTFLNDSIVGTTMEYLAQWLLARFAFLLATKVIVRQPTLGYAVEARPEA